MVHLGRPGSFGGKMRSRGLTDIFEHAGARVVDVPLMLEHRASARDLLHPGLWPVVTGEAVPESLAWSHRDVLRRLEQVDPTIVVCSTARSYHPELRRGPWTIVLDYVDCLSDSYRDRATIVGRSVRSVGFRALSVLAGRFERRPRPPGMIGIAAGWSDAESLGLTWVPNTFPLASPAPGVAARHDLLFLGKLSYEPNVEAIEALARMWPAIQRRRPGTTLVLAGADPTTEVRELADRLGWTVEADFADLDLVMAEATLAVVPLVHASGIQSKVLDAARYGLAQVLSPAAVAGMAPDFPAVVADTDERFVAAVAELLDDPEQRVDLGLRSRAHFAATYTSEHWVAWAEQTLEDALANGRP